MEVLDVGESRCPKKQRPASSLNLHEGAESQIRKRRVLRTHYSNQESQPSKKQLIRENSGPYNFMQDWDQYRSDESATPQIALQRNGRPVDMAGSDAMDTEDIAKTSQMADISGKSDDTDENRKTKTSSTSSGIHHDIFFWMIIVAISI